MVKYIKTAKNVMVNIHNKSYIIANDDYRYNKVVEALEQQKSSYIIKQIIEPDETIEKAKELLHASARNMEKY